MTGAIRSSRRAQFLMDLLDHARRAVTVCPVLAFRLRRLPEGERLGDRWFRGPTSGGGLRGRLPAADPAAAGADDD